MNINALEVAVDTTSMVDTVHGHQVAHCFSPRVEVGTSRLVLVFKRFLAKRTYQAKLGRVLECQPPILWGGERICAKRILQQNAISDSFVLQCLTVRLGETGSHRLDPLC